MLKVELVLYPLRFEDRARKLENTLNKIESSGGTILHITSDSEGYTIVYRKTKKALVE